ncbi:MAG: hypothetical protein QNJ09_08405 [Paracoccaceae bacterium]|nr:hypothetical protein [Paracoccaceae bacterium]
MAKRGPTLLAALAVISGAALAETKPQLEPLPDFQTCMDIELARFERKLAMRQPLPVDKALFDTVSVVGVDYCGSVGIVNCDRGGDTQNCQLALEVEQDTLRDKVLAQLPPPAEAPSERSQQLYAQVWALAQGTTAGPDCDGAEPAFATWCRAREANSRLQNAVLAWQIVRFQGLVPPSAEAGWTRTPPPTRPVARPEEG